MKTFDAVALHAEWQAGSDTMHDVAVAAGVDPETFESVCRLAARAATLAREHAFQDMGLCPVCYGDREHLLIDDCDCDPED